VDQYLLKPLRSEVLSDAIKKVVDQIEKSKTQNELLTEFNQQELFHALYQHFMCQLFFEGSSTNLLLERARALDIDIIHPFYQVILFHFDNGHVSGNRTEFLRNKIAERFGDNRTALHYFNGSDQLALLVFAQNKDTLNENGFRMLNIIRHELKDRDLVITTVIGNIVQRLSAVKDAYSAADTMIKKLLGVCAGQIIDINDTAQITTEIVNFNSSFGELFSQRLLYASIDDVPALLDEFWNESNSDQYNSMLFRYYTLIDFLKTAVQIVSTAKPDIDQKDIAAQFSSVYDILVASNHRDTFKKLALEILQEAVRMKQENPSFIKHSHVISKAEEYISRQYCDPNISLISVAKHIGLSSAHFSTIFSQTIGKTFISYLTSLRIEKAKELLSQTDRKLSAIAMDIGYNEPNYFSHVFKKCEGITPKEYRNSFNQRS